ncbi:unnamed protein product [Heligmosomoides polygyrus]|uniref:Uncharacterized protein n=1 Tax=Heligmosomoides polygyrus TaxID=6339 RepID=A0A183GR45_HELPZ|nr:unnamed protein product [Heligmosomoides polygyrus]
MSHDEELRQIIMNMPPNYEKEKPPEKIAIEHIGYNYESGKQAQEKLAVLSCPHSIGFHADRLAIVDLDESSENYCKVRTASIFESFLAPPPPKPFWIERESKNRSVDPFQQDLRLRWL